MAKSPNIRGHKLKVGKPGRDGTVSGRCSCGGWSGTASNVTELTAKWNRSHVNKFDNYR